uniref:LRRCT domain-containing protein n=1 Tax=Cairina moschata TaxID=8855 RepID=A0A8C3CF30_CAIMO
PPPPPPPPPPLLPLSFLPSSSSSSSLPQPDLGSGAPGASSRRLDEPPRELPASVHNLSIAIEDMALQGLPALRTLDLSHNPLLSVASGAFSGLAGNRLQELPSALLLEAPGLRGLRVSLGANPLHCDCALRPLLAWLRSSATRVLDARSLRCSGPPPLRGTSLLRLRPEGLGCGASEGGEAGRLETASYVFFGIVLALIGIVFLMVLYLNRRGIKRWLHNLREACRDQMEGYHYRYEQDADPRRASTAGTPGL